MYCYTTDSAGSKRKERAYEAEAFITHLPPHLRDDFPECDVFDRLAAFNAQVDSRLSQSVQMWNHYFHKKREGGIGPVARTLRLCVQSVRPANYLDLQPSWCLRIEGRLMTGPNERPSSVLFSHFIKHLSVELEGREYQTDSFIEWDNRRQIGETHGFEISRPGKKPVKCKIIVEIAYPVQLFTVSEALSSILGGSAHSTLEHVIRGLWMYMKEHKLETDYESGNIICNETMSKLLGGVASFALEDLPRLVRMHLNPPPPLVIEHEITPGVDSEMQCFDIQVQEPHESLPAASHKTKEIVDLDRQVSELVTQIGEAAKKHRAYKEMAADPAGFVRRLARTNARDVLFVEAQEALEGPVPDQFFESPYVQNAAHQYLLSQQLKKLEEQEAAWKKKKK